MDTERPNAFERLKNALSNGLDFAHEQIGLATSKIQTRKRMDNSASQETIYYNYLMIAPDGTEMCRIDNKKAQWYVKRHLADLEESGDGVIVRLKFDPNGMGHSGDYYALEPREDRCVVCGTLEDISRHHVVPKCFIRYMELKDKEHRIRNVIPLCVECHMSYEQVAEPFKYFLAGGDKAVEEAKAAVRDKNRAITFASTIINVFDSLPIDKLEEMWNVCLSYLKKEDLTYDELQKLARSEKENWTSILFKKVVNELENVEEFAEMWREHFIETMNPQYLPESYLHKHPLA